LFEFVAGILRPEASEFTLALPLNEKLERTKNRDLIDADLAPVTTVTIRFKDTQSTSKLSIFILNLLFRSTFEGGFSSTVHRRRG
jgi:hypothetical protein